MALIFCDILFIIGLGLLLLWILGLGHVILPSVGDLLYIFLVIASFALCFAALGQHRHHYPDTYRGTFLA